MGYRMFCSCAGYTALAHMGVLPCYPQQLRSGRIHPEGPHPKACARELSARGNGYWPMRWRTTSKSITAAAAETLSDSM